MRITRMIGVVGLVLALCFPARGQSPGVVAVQFNLTDFISDPQAVQRLVLTPIPPAAGVGVLGSNILVPVTISRPTGISGSVLISNVPTGYPFTISLQSQGNPPVTVGTWTEYFPTNLSGTVSATNGLGFTNVGPIFGWVFAPSYATVAPSTNVTFTTNNGVLYISSTGSGGSGSGTNTYAVFTNSGNIAAGGLVQEQGNIVVTNNQSGVILGSGSTVNTATNFTGALAGNVIGSQSSTVVSVVPSTATLPVNTTNVTTNANGQLTTAAIVLTNNEPSAVLGPGSIANTATNFTGSLIGNVTGAQGATVVSVVPNTATLPSDVTNVTTNSAGQLTAGTNVVTNNATGVTLNNVIINGATGTNVALFSYLEGAPDYRGAPVYDVKAFGPPAPGTWYVVATNNAASTIWSIREAWAQTNTNCYPPPQLLIICDGKTNTYYNGTASGIDFLTFFNAQGDSYTQHGGWASYVSDTPFIWDFGGERYIHCNAFTNFMVLATWPEDTGSTVYSDVFYTAGTPIDFSYWSLQEFSALVSSGATFTNSIIGTSGLIVSLYKFELSNLQSYLESRPALYTVNNGKIYSTMWNGGEDFGGTSFYGVLGDVYCNLFGSWACNGNLQNKFGYTYGDSSSRNFFGSITRGLPFTTSAAVVWTNQIASSTSNVFSVELLSPLP